MRKFLITGILATSFIIPTAAQASSAPNVRCHRLDRAERTLHRKGFNTVERGGGLFGILVRSGWVVVNQRQRGHTVTLTAGRFC